MSSEVRCHGVTFIVSHCLALSRTRTVSHCLAEHLQLVLVPLCVVPDLSGCSASETNKGHGTFPSESEQMKKIAWTLDNMEKR